MTSKLHFVAAVSAATLLLLAACGGGGNESGPAESVLASPDNVRVNGPAGQCASGLGPTVYLYGGRPTYKLNNSAPTAMILSTSQVAGSGEGFTITFTGTCLEAIPITVEDDMGRVLPIPISNVKGPILG